MRRSKKRKLRTEEAAKKENQERRAQREFVAVNHRKVQRRQSVRGRLAMHDGLMAGTLLEVKRFAADVQQRHDISEIILTVCAKAALGRELSEEDRDVLEDFLSKVGEATEEQASDAGPSPDVQPGG